MRSTVLTTVLGVALAPAVVLTGAGAADAAAPRCAGERATIVGTSGADRLRGTSGRDVVLARGGSDRVLGLGGDDVLCGGRGRDVLDGAGGDDTVRGGAGSNRLRGGSGADRLVSGPRSVRQGFTEDVALGGAGDDVVVSRAGAETIVSYGDATGPAVVDLAAGRSTAPGLGRDRLVGVTIVLGSAYADRLTGSDADEFLQGRGGADELVGAGGSDFLVTGRGADVADGGDGFDLAVATQGDRVDSGRGGDFVVSVGRVARPIEVATGPGADFFLAYGGTVDLDGGAGLDELALPDFSDFEGAPAPGSGSVDLGLGTLAYQDADIQVEGTLARFEGVTGSAGDDVLVGDGGANGLDGGGGDDDLRGAAGDDLLLGSGGADRLDGGADVDVCTDRGARTVRVDCEGTASPGRRASERTLRAVGAPSDGRSWAAALARVAPYLPR